MAGNSRTFYKRRSYYSKKTGKKNPRVPRRSYKRKEDHSDLFTDENPKGTVKGMKFKSRKDAVSSIKKLKSLYKRKKISYAHMRQIGTTMEQRSRYHSHPTKDIKEANKVWKRFNKSFKRG